MSSPRQVPPAPDRDRPLDGLRGLCAALVFYAHAFAPSAVLDPRWAPPPQFWWLNLGYAAVMMFFVLSGYVIGLTTTGPASGPATRRYLSRRALRLLPVTWAAVLLAWALQPGHDLATVLGNFLFLQNSQTYPGGATFGLLTNNTNLWSLNYEAVYYLGFIVLWRWSPRPAWIWAGLALAALAAPAGVPQVEVLSHYACGGLYWFAGLLIARRTEPLAPGETRRGNWPAAFLAVYALWTLALLRQMIVGLEWYPFMGLTPASLHRIDFLPACVWCLLAVSGRAPALRRVLTGVTLAWTAIGVGYVLLHGQVPVSGWLATAAFAVAVLLHRWTPDAVLLARLAPLGAVSFGLYAFALPLQFGQRGILPAFAGSPLTFSVRLAVTAALALGLAYVIELRFTPWLRRRALR